jgi:asparagine synthase (glutamine-hydrolysing)
MCGIAVEIKQGTGEPVDTGRVIQMLSAIALRGDPENFGQARALPGAAMGCNRLAIVARGEARQPMFSGEGTRCVVFNGEIYNHERLRAELEARGYSFATSSDTEVLLHGYAEWGTGLPSRLDGIFAFVVYDSATGEFLCARDPLGVKPLYWASVGDTVYFASELKCYLSVGAVPRVFPPGHVMKNGNLLRYYFEPDGSLPYSAGPDVVGEFARRLEEAVRKRVQTDLPIAVIYSGGLDSASVLALAAKHHHDVTAVTVGFPGSPDLEFATRSCRDLGIRHVTRLLNLQQCIDSLSRRVWETETFEMVDIMDATVMAPAFEAVHELGIKVALVGDGSDELLAGYDLFREHPDPVALMRYRVGNLHRTDLQRVDRASMSHSVEARVPFLDRDVVDLAWRMDTRLKHKHGTEKWILREAMSDVLPGYLAWRPKIRMPEGTGLLYQLIEHASKQPADIDPSLLHRLNLGRAGEAHFLDLYLRRGYPVPAERYKRASWDFSENGYFAFQEQGANYVA